MAMDKKTQIKEENALLKLQQETANADITYL
jgi:hypothetical protein